MSKVFSSTLADKPKERQYVYWDEKIETQDCILALNPINKDKQEIYSPFKKGQKLTVQLDPKNIGILVRCKSGDNLRFVDVRHLSLQNSKLVDMLKLARLPLIKKSLIAKIDGFDTV